MNPSTAFATVLADELARCGLREVVVAPGSRSTPLAMAFWELERAGRARLHVRIDERSAAFTALGLAKASRGPVAVLCTSGTAAANFHPAVMEADESAVPLLVLTADRPPELRGTGANQTVDQVKLYGAAVRWYAEAGVPERRPGMAGYWRSLACRAWAQASGAVGTLPGPVHLNIPLRDPLVPATPGAAGPVSAGSLPGDSARGDRVPANAAPATTMAETAWSAGTGHGGAAVGAAPLTRPGHAGRDRTDARDQPLRGSDTKADNSNKRASAPAAGVAAGLPLTDAGMREAAWPESLMGRGDGGPWTRTAPVGPAAGPLELPWAERGVVVCGDGDYDADALVDLAERAGWPLLAEPSSGARRGPNALTGYQYLLASPGFMAAHRPQVIVSAGRPGLSRPQSALLALAGDAASDLARPDGGHSGTPEGRGTPEGSGAPERTGSDEERGRLGGATGAGDRGEPDTPGGHREDGGPVSGDGAGSDTGVAEQDGEAGRGLAVRHVVLASGPGLWADPQRAATDVAASIRLTGVPATAGGGRWLGAWRRADAAATEAAVRALGRWDRPRPGSEPGPVSGAPAVEPTRAPEAASPGDASRGALSHEALSHEALSHEALARAALAADGPIARSAGELTPDGKPAAAASAVGLSEPGVARELIAALPENALLWCGNSLSVRDVDVLLPPRADIRVIASRGASGIDGTFSTAAGAAMAHAAEHPGAVGFALIGDLSLLHDAPGLAIGPAEPRPDLCVVVVNNDGGGIFEELEPARFKEAGPGAAPSVFERVFGTSHGASVERLAAAFGLPYALAERPGDLAKAVASAVPGAGPRIVEARTWRAANAGLRARMRAAAVSAAEAAARAVT